MKTSEATNEIAGALAKAQGKMLGAKRDQQNPFFKNKYADLASVWDACREALSSNGIAVVQMTERSDKDEVIVTTRLCHSSGQWYEGELAMPVSKTDAQGFGSAMTYARRYALAAAVGVAPEDDDANAAIAARPNSASQVNKDAFDDLDATTKDWIIDHAKTLVHLWETNGDMLGYLEMQEFDTESKLALWSQLPSKVRSAIKHAQQVSAVVKGAQKHKEKMAESSANALVGTDSA